MRILADTNIIISAILFPNSLVARVWSHIIKHHHVIISKYSVGELEMVFRRKFPDDIDALRRFLTHLTCEIADAGQPDIEIPPIRDKTDLPILTSAIVANADILLTGDKDFTDVSLNKPVVMSPAAFMKSFIPNT